MDIYSNGQTRYNNLMNQFNNPFGNQEDEAFKIGQALGNIGKNAYDAFNKPKADGIDTELTEGIGSSNTNDIINNLGTMDPKKMEELTQLYAKANL